MNVGLQTAAQILFGAGLIRLGAAIVGPIIRTIPIPIDRPGPGPGR